MDWSKLEIVIEKWLRQLKAKHQRQETYKDHRSREYVRYVAYGVVQKEALEQGTEKESTSMHPTVVRTVWHLCVKN